MRIHKSFLYPSGVDLDNPETYRHLPESIRDLDNLMFQEIGKAYCYMNYFHYDLFNTASDKPLYKAGTDQRRRVEDMIKEFCENRANNYGNILWYKEKVFLFQDETENMC